MARPERRAAESRHTPVAWRAFAIPGSDSLVLRVSWSSLGGALGRVVSGVIRMYELHTSGRRRPRRTAGRPRLPQRSGGEAHRTTRRSCGARHSRHSRRCRGDQITFPVTRDSTVLHLSRPLADQQLVCHKAPVAPRRPVSRNPCVSSVAGGRVVLAWIHQGLDSRPVSASISSVISRVALMTGSLPESGRSRLRARPE